MRPLSYLVLAACLTVTSYSPTWAQTVSIIMIGESDSYIVEAAMKRNLRAEGYTVKGGTTEGFVLVVQTLPIKLRDGSRGAVAGGITIGHLQWQKFGDLVVSQACKEEHELAQQVKEMLGTKMTLIESTIAYAGDNEALAEMLSTFANREIRKAHNKIAEFFEALDAQQRPAQRDVISPYR